MRGKENRAAEVVFTVGRRCRHCWPGEEDLVGEVDVHSVVLPHVQLLAPGRCSAPSARRGGGVLLSRLSSRGRGNRKHQKGWWLGLQGSGLSLVLKPGTANAEEKAPSCPDFDRPGGRGGTGAFRSS
jgi:hypothetical protein